MNKAELVNKVMRYTGLRRTESMEAVKGIIRVIKDSLARGEKVTLAGFGTFRVGTRKARPGRNPQTGESMQIPARKVPVFKAGKRLKEEIR